MRRWPGRCVGRGAALVGVLAALVAPRTTRAQGGSPLAEARVMALPEAERGPWAAYLQRSRELQARERAALTNELAAAGLSRSTRAPLLAESFVVTPEILRPEFLASDSARRIAEIVVSFQDPGGGWSKHLDLRDHLRRPGESFTAEGDDWQWVGTTDLGSTTSEIRFLLAMDAVRAEPRYRASARRGVEYLFGSQMPSGCWPQVYPLMGGYHDAVAIADDATSSILALLREVSASRWPALTASDETLPPRAESARRRGIACVLPLQRAVAGVPAAWTYYYDPISGESLAGRSWEPPALAPLETASLLDELIADSLPSEEAQRAAHGAAAWLARTALAGYGYAGFTLRPSRGAALLWPRLVGLDDGRPLFSDRDGVRRAEWNELTDRRTGYIWFGGDPAQVLERYARWASGHPATGALAPVRVPTDTVARLPGRRMEVDSASLLSAKRLRSLPAAKRATWTRYLARSRELSALDHRSMDEELRAAGRTGMRRGPWTHGFSVTSEMTPAWFATDTARRMAESILSYQTPSGGWSKHVEFRAGVRLPGVSYNGESSEWRYIPTIDNASTTEEIRFLAQANAGHPDPRYTAAIDAGVKYLLDAQMPNGCWSQVFPLQGGYHDAATFNDDAIVNVARLMRDVAAGTVPVSGTIVRLASDAEREAVRCMLDAQVVVRGRPTVWGQQHDPITLRPTSARSYELASLTGDESVGLARYLMAIPAPDARVVAAVHAAADWFRANGIAGIDYANYRLTRRNDAEPVWARMVEISTGRPIFANRDGVKLYDFARLTDRRSGYRWFTTTPGAFLREYERWAIAHPRGAASPRAATTPSTDRP